MVGRNHPTVIYGRPLKGGGTIYSLCLSTNEAIRLAALASTDAERRKWRALEGVRPSRKATTSKHDTDGMWMRVSTITRKPYQGPVYNLVVEDDHSYVVEGLAVHNSQQFIVDFASDAGVEAVRPHHTGRNKHDLVNGVESLATELDQAKWILPCSDNEVPGDELGKLIKGCMLYDPTQPAEHTSDWLMAWWICREAIRNSLAANMGGGLRLPGEAEMHGLLDR
jgi:hypothetical protein